MLATFLLAGCLLPALKENTGNGAAPSSSTPAPVMSLLAGGASGSGSADGQGSNARFFLPQGVAVDTVNHLTFIADTGNDTIRVVDASGNVTTLAGQAGKPGAVDTVTQNGTTTPTPTGKQPSDALFSAPTGVAVQVSAGSDTVYVADTGNATIRMISVTVGASGPVATAVTTIAGQAGVPGSTPGPYGVSLLAAPTGMVLDNTGSTLYVVDVSNCLVLAVDLRTPAQGGVTPSGLPAGTALAQEASAFELSTLAGAAGQLNPVSRDGIGTAATFAGPTGIAFDTYSQPVSSGTVTSPVLYVADAGGNTVRALYYNSNVQNWVVVTLAGNTNAIAANGNTINTAGYSDGGAAPTAGSAAGAPATIPATPYSVVQAGSNFSFQVGQHVDQASSTDPFVLFNAPTGIVVDPTSHNLYVTDAGNDVIRELQVATVPPSSSTNSGTTTTTFNENVTVSTIAGMVPLPMPGIPVAHADEASSLVYYPGFADSAASGRPTNVAEQKLPPDNPLLDAAQLAVPAGLAGDGAGGFFLADMGNSLIRHVTPATSNAHGEPLWNVVTVAGSVAPDANAKGAAAGFNGPQGLDADGNGNVYVADSGNDLVRKIDSNGNVTTLAGLVGVAGEVNGLGTAARFNSPAGLVVDRQAQKIYVADSGSGAVRVIDFTGNASTLPISGVTLLQPVALALDGHGHLYVADAGASPQPGQVAVVSLADNSASVLPGGTLSPLQPDGVAVTPDGATVYVADRRSGVIDVFSTQASQWSSRIGNGSSGYADGAAATAEFYLPAGLVLDPSGKLLVADQANQLVRQVTVASSPVTVSTVVGVPGNVGAGYVMPGLLTNPVGLAMLGTTLYISSGNRIVAVTNL